MAFLLKIWHRQVGRKISLENILNFEWKYKEGWKYYLLPMKKNCLHHILMMLLCYTHNVIDMNFSDVLKQTQSQAKEFGCKS